MLEPSSRQEQTRAAYGKQKVGAISAFSSKSYPRSHFSGNQSFPVVLY